MTTHEIWQAVLAEFELSLSKAHFTTWFKNTGIAEYDDGKAIICVPNSFTKSWLEKKHHSQIIKILERVTGKPIKKIDYLVENIKNIKNEECKLTTQNTQFSSSNPLYNNKQKITLGQRFGLNSKYTF
ncbi:MAG: DnaA N-terminal domain-containing protein, partial [Candidatus Magasanikbacteria bacterium]